MKSALKEWYMDLPPKERKVIKKQIMRECGISKQSFYDYLTKEPPKLVKYEFLKYVFKPLETLALT